MSAFFPNLHAALPVQVAELLDFLANAVNLQFGFGFAVGLIFLNRRNILSFDIFGGGLTLLILAIAVFALAAFFDLRRPDLLKTIVLASLSAIVLLVALVIEPAQGLLDKVARLLGDASYSIYLTHGGATLVFLEAWLRSTHCENLFLIEIVGVIFSVSCGVVIHIYVERKVVLWAKQRLVGSRITTSASRSETPS
jgi:exopolysaccharide production protein ExoZ